MLKHQGAGIALTVLVFYLELIAGQDLPEGWTASLEKFLNQEDALKYCDTLKKDGSMWKLALYEDEDAKRIETVLDFLDKKTAYWIDMKCLPKYMRPKSCDRWSIAPEVIDLLWAKGQPTGVTGESPDPALLDIPEYCAQFGYGYAEEKGWGINDVPCEGYEGYALCKKQEGDR